MSHPVRIQMRRSKGWRLPEDARYVGRPTRWGNPFQVGDLIQISGTQYGEVGRYSAKRALGYDLASPAGLSVEQAVALYRKDLERALAGGWGAYEPDENEIADRDELSAPCHADVLLDLANR